MSKVYDYCPQSVMERVEALVEKHHQDLKIAEVKFDLMFVSRSDDDEGTKPVLTLHGVPCLAIVRIVPLKERAKGCGDAEILIDRDRYNDSAPEQQDALLDHELQHLEVQRGEDNSIKTDDQHRPKLKMRPHDYDFGWFECIARRHGKDSIEVQQARLMFDQHGHSLFPFAAWAESTSETEG